MNNMYKNHTRSENYQRPLLRHGRLLTFRTWVSAVRSPCSLACACCKTPSIDVRTYVVYAELIILFKFQATIYFKVNEIYLAYILVKLLVCWTLSRAAIIAP